jgi:alpha-tubulin suppressor-like RCC1 family protein
LDGERISLKRLLPNGWSLVLLCGVFLLTGPRPIEASLAGATMHTCVVTGGGGAVCWGLNFSGQLGDGTTTNRTAPVAVSLPTGVVVTAITMGTSHTCALTAAGGVLCWGDNFQGELGDGTTTNRSMPVAVSGLTSGVTAIAAGFEFTCAVTSGGGVVCWGFNNDGQLGNNTTTSNKTPVAVVDSNGVAITAATAITAGASHACAVTSSGTVLCWGLNGQGQLGDNTTTSRSTALAVAGNWANVTVTAVTASGLHTCALTGGGTVLCWGDNFYGQLGDGTTTNRLVPVVSGLAGVSRIAAGTYHTCGLTVAGGVFCWGNNGNGQLGTGPITMSLTPVAVNGLSSGVTAIVAGAFHTCAQTSSPTVRCWGNNFDGQLGDGVNWYASTPGAVTGLTSGITAVATGDHTCALNSAGGVSCWGYNALGELGDGTNINGTTPVAVSGLASGVTAIATGYEFTCGLTTGHAVLCWGDNSSGQLGDGTNTNRFAPVAVSGSLPAVAAIAAGDFHTCALTTGHAVFCWGDNSTGQVGDNTNTNRSAPVPVTGFPGGTAIAAITAGAAHMCALTTAGGVYCWGNNGNGELGDNTTTQRLTPVAVSGLASGVTAIAAGGYHTCALMSTGLVKCWGFNGSGQLGINSTTTLSLTPVTAGVTSVTAIAAGLYHTCALIAGGISCWGDNSAGELGDGTTTNRLAPVPVTTLPAASVLAARTMNTCAILTTGGVSCWGGNNYGELGNGTAGYSVDSVAVLLPALTTAAASAISAVAASDGVSVTADGGVLITARGVCWSASAGPTLANSCISSGIGTGSFTASLTGLSPQTMYHARAYVTNALGTFFGNEVTFTTIVPTMAVDHAALIFAAVSDSTKFTAGTAPQIVRLIESGGGTVTWTATANQPWLVVTPGSGTGSGTLSVFTKFTTGLTATQSGSITITLTGAGNTVGPIAVTLNVLNVSPPPFGSFDSPTDGVTGVAGSIPVTGWALDAVGVTRVTICRDAVTGEAAQADTNCAGNAQIYIGDAVFIDGARSDVQTLNPTVPLNSRAGWGYLMLTNFLPNIGNGTFTLRAYAFDAAGLTALLGTKTITCANGSSTAPFGAIDSPGQGAIVSGTGFLNFGWVLAKGGRTDPPGGGTVQVFVDGAVVGSPGAWGSRTDLTAAFTPASSYPGINTALGVYGLDTTAFANGVHTIFWIATGAGGIGTSGIGSRFITVSNGSDVAGSSSSVAASASSVAGSSSGVADQARSIVIPSAPMADLSASAVAHAGSLDAEVAAAPEDPGPVPGRRGYDLDAPLQTYTPSSGRLDVQAEELDRIELHLGRTGQQRYTGYLQTAGGLRPLPVGSSLDASTGTFTWMPGVGFYGAYDLTFVRWTGANAVARQDVRITLNAKGSNRIGPQTIIDAPVAGSTVGSPFFVGGWAADLDSTVDTGVNTVHVWAYPVDANGNRLDPIFVGPATYGGARPDVAAIYGARFENSGYGIIVNGLAPGTYDIAVFAFSTVTNSFTPAKIVRVKITNDK